MISTMGTLRITIEREIRNTVGWSYWHNSRHPLYLHELETITAEVWKSIQTINTPPQTRKQVSLRDSIRGWI